MTDNATHPRIIALRAIVSKLSAGADDYANIYKEIRALDKTDPDIEKKRKALADRLTKIMLCLVSQAHLIQCRFFHTMAEASGEYEAMNMLRDAVIDAHENEEKETDHLDQLMKGHAPWQM